MCMWERKSEKKTEKKRMKNGDVTIIQYVCVVTTSQNKTTSNRHLKIKFSRSEFLTFILKAFI